MGEINVVLGAELTPMRGGLDDLAEEFKCRLAEGALGILAVDVDVVTPPESAVPPCRLRD